MKQLLLPFDPPLPRPGRSHLQGFLRSGWFSRGRSRYDSTKHLGWRQNDRYYFRCPFHRERTPSCVYTVSLRKFHCYGCGMNGTGRRLGYLLKTCLTVEKVDGIVTLSGFQRAQNWGTWDVPH